MEITVNRRWKKAEYTVGQLFVDDELFCNTMEDADRGLDNSMQDFMIRSKKIPNRTAVPTGRYEINMNTVSPSFSKKQFYMDVCKGKLPRLMQVKGFDGILIHCGTNHTHSSGCILVGYNKKTGQLTDSKEVFEALYKKMKKAYDKGEKIFINIQ